LLELPINHYAFILPITYYLLPITSLKSYVSMTKLEDLTRSAIVSGILPNQNVTIIDVKWHGSDVVELTYKDYDWYRKPNGLD
jgi:hypothetical protein